MLALMPYQILYATGRWLSSDCRLPVRVEVVNEGTWYHHDLTFAFAWKKAAEKAGLTVNVFNKE